MCRRYGHADFACQQDGYCGSKLYGKATGSVDFGHLFADCLDDFVAEHTKANTNGKHPEKQNIDRCRFGLINALFAVNRQQRS